MRGSEEMHRIGSYLYPCNHSWNFADGPRKTRGRPSASVVWAEEQQRQRVELFAWLSIRMSKHIFIVAEGTSMMRLTIPRVVRYKSHIFTWETSQLAFWLVKARERSPEYLRCPMEKGTRMLTA